MGFSSLVIISGVLCFLLDKRWFVGVRPMWKVPLYTVLGTSVSFALTFAACDVANYVLGFFQATIAKPLIDSTNQVTLVLVLSTAVGAIYGFIFGAVDGALGGIGNEFLRVKDNFELSTEWDADI